MRVPNLIGGRFVDSQSSTSIDATQEVVSQFPVTTSEEFRAAVFVAKRAFPSWRNIALTTRQRIMFKFQELIRRDIDKIALNITIEQGKTLKDAHSDLLYGLEVVEQACGIANLQVGEFVSNVLNEIDTYNIREPLGICAGICPFNFPAMVPLWAYVLGAGTMIINFSPAFGKLMSEEQQLEGEYRQLHSRLRTHSESIAFYGDEIREESHIQQKFKPLV